MDKSGRPYLRHPTIGGGRIAFIAEDDVWEVPLEGGVARRVTFGDGVATLPRLSADGTQVAYTRQDAAGQEIYVTPVAGGPACQLTGLGAFSFARGWTEDGDVVFASDTGQPFVTLQYLYAVPAGGGPVRPLGLGPARDVAWGTDGTVVVGRNTADPARWKRYRGGAAGKLWVDRRGTGRFRPILRALDANLGSPMCFDGRVWFLSDHEGTGNVYSCTPAGAGVRRHTHHDGIYARLAAAAGGLIAYQHGGDIRLLNPVAGADAVLDVEVPIAGTRRRARRVSAAAGLGAPRPIDAGAGLITAVASDGERIALEARGRVVAFGATRGAVQALGRGDARQRLPRFLGDGSVVVVIEETGGAHLAVHAPDGTSRRVAELTHGRVADVAVNPQDTMAATTTHHGEVVLYDLVTGLATAVDRSEHGLCGAVTWSADGRWLAYSRPVAGQFIRQIRVHDAQQGTTHDVTPPEFGDGQPSFDPTGRYLYFVSARAFEPLHGPMGFELHFPRPTRPFVAVLDPRDPAPFEETAIAAGEPAVDMAGLAFRIRPLPVPAGRYGQLIAVRDGAVLRSDPIAGSLEFTMVPLTVPADSELLHVAACDGKVTTFAEGVTDFTADPARRHLLVRSGRTFRRISLDGDRTPRDVDIDRVKVSVNAAVEWARIFDEAWQLISEFYWEPTLGGIDWEAMRARYAPLVDRLRCRGDLSDLVWELYGELGVGHAYEFGGDYDLPAADAVAHLGADMQWDARGRAWTIERIVTGDAWNPAHTSALLGPGLDVTAGDRIVAIDGEDVSAAVAPTMQLAGRAGQDVLISVARGRGRRATRDVSVRPLADERPARYRDWVTRNRAAVHAATDGRAGYIHLPNMGPPGYGEFHRAFFAEFGREALVVDVRFNTGGFVSTLVLDKLVRRRFGAMVSRWQSTAPYPRQAVQGIVVGICNEHAGSDGDLFSHAFRTLDIGPLVGVRTWGGVIGISTKEPHADGTITAQPELAHWFPDLGYDLEGRGATPTHEVDVHPGDEIAGRDRQLDKALELVRRALPRQPKPWPSTTRVPDRRPAPANTPEV